MIRLRTSQRCPRHSSQSDQSFLTNHQLPLCRSLKVKIGLNIGPRGAAGTPDGLIALVRKAEEVGFTSIGLPDHIVFPRKSDARYPYNVDGKHPSNVTGYALEQLACLAWIAGQTSKLRLVTSVMVVPHRHPILAAKMLATIDVLSRGRLTVGVGVGWLEEEIEALGAARFRQRGAATDAFIRAFRELWTSGDPQGDARFVKLDGLMFEPKPVQKPHPPIWIGGEGKAARERAARLGDGWHPLIRNPAVPLDRPELFKTALAEVHRLAELAGRDPSTIDVAAFANALSLGVARKDADGRRTTFTGSADDIAADCESFAAAGARHLMVGFESNDLAQSLDRIEALGREVITKVR